MPFLKIPGRSDRKKNPVAPVTPVLVPLVPTSKHKKGLKDEVIFQKEQEKAEQGAGEGDHQSQVMGGGPDGDGTGIPGGYDPVHDEWLVTHIPILAGWLGREPVEGRDFPSAKQLKIGRKFYEARDGKKIGPNVEQARADLEGDDINEADPNGHGIER